MTDISFEEKLKFLEEVYWDLVSLKILGANIFVQPFQFVSAMPVKEIKNVLSHQNSKTQALTILHLPDQARRDYVKDLSFENKKTLVEETLEMDEVLIADIETASETLKFEINKMDGGKESVSIRSLAPKLLGSFSTLDEIKLLRDITKRVSDGGKSVKTNYPTLAFIDEWPEEKARLVLDSANADEVLTLLRVMPDSKEKILSYCPPRVQTIVGDDIGREDKTDNETKEKHLATLRAKFMKTINNQKIDLNSIFENKESSRGLHAA